MKDVLFHIKEGEIALKEGKKILILAPISDQSEANESTVKALLNAIKMDYDDVQLHYFDRDLDQIPSQVKIVIVFGHSINILKNLNLKIHKPLNLEGTILLSTYQLNDLALDKNKKMQLWKVLQNTFLK